MRRRSVLLAVLGAAAVGCAAWLLKVWTRPPALDAGLPPVHMKLGVGS